MVPVAAGMFFYTFLISFDMVLVRSYLSAQDSGAYAISQMLGKIFLFLPGAVSFVLFPRSSGLHASSMDTRGVLKKSLAFALFLCLGAALFYNLFPDLVLKILTGKTGPHSVLLGRFFSFSMTFFALLYVFINYFLSIHDFRFIKYLALGSLAQFLAITFFHDNVFQVQYILSISAFSLTSVCYFLSFGRNK
jgi:O-antigen/teichoic acid export membrane protein